MPVDADPVEDGNLQVDWERGDAHVLPRHSDYSGPRYNSHFLTCPNAKQHRKPKQTAAEIDAAVDKATAALDPKKRETEPPKPDFSGLAAEVSPHPDETAAEFAARLKSRLPPDLKPSAETEAMMLMLGEAIAGGGEAGEATPRGGRCRGREMRATWRGRECRILIRQGAP